MNKKGFEGLKVVFFESRHTQTMTQLITLHRGTPLAAPALREVPLEQNKHIFSFGEKLLKGEIQVMVFLTGVGTRFLMKVLEIQTPKETILQALGKIPIVARGPKPIRVLDELKLPIAIKVPPPNTWKDLLESLDQNKVQVPVKDRLVAVQEYGITNEELLAGLRDRGARVLSVPVYRWALPEDTGPLKKAIQEMVSGSVSVVVFTTAIQIIHVLKVAHEMNLEKNLKEAFKKIVVSSVGPDCTETLNANGVKVDIQAENSKMSSLIKETAEKAKSALEKIR